MRSYIRTWVCVLVLTLACGSAFAALQSFITMRNGYFFDASTGKPWVPHGIAYQTWNRPLGVWQTPEQLRYDLDEIKKMGANSIRVDFVWKHVEETADNSFKWTNYDLLVSECEKRDLRIFALVGYQWPPDWFQDAWYTMHPPEVDAEGILHTNRWQSDIINYEHPTARSQYSAWISAVCARYKNSKAIVAWIIGNEYGYLGLWSGLLDGYDPQCETAFRTYVTQKYTTLTNLNATWGTSYTNFNQVGFPEQYRAYGVEGAIWADAVQWRENSIASFTALGAKAAKTADTNHLISYSTVGMQWGEEDWRYHAEDRGKITAYAAASNAPIDFFSVNNYPWSILGHESQNGHWGVSFTKKVANVPVLYTETGFTSSESMWPGMNEQRQGPLVRNAMWESLEVGAIGTHIFSWMDRPWITDREKGFGIVYADRGIKPAFWTSANAFRLMEQAKIADLLAGSKDPTPDIAFLWTDAVDSQYNRYECEMQQIAGALERIGYEPNFINLAELGSGVYTNYKIIILPRNMRVEDVVPNSTNKTVLEFLRTVVLPKGIHVMASADIPAAQNFSGKPRSQYVNEVRSLFGVDPSDPGGFEVPMRRNTYVNLEHWKKIFVRFNTNASSPVANFVYRPYVWKFNDEVTLSTGGVLWANMDCGRNKGFESSTNNILPWSQWKTTTYIPSSTAALVRLAGWQYSGSNMMMLRGDAGIWADAEIVPFGRYSASAWLRCNTTNALSTGAYASVGIEWYGESNRYLGVSESAVLTTHTANAWVKYSVIDNSPTNSKLMRRIIRTGSKNLVANPGLTGTGTAPTSWLYWNDTQHDPNSSVCLGTSGNSWQFWYDGGLYQDLTTGFAAGDKLSFGGWLYTPSSDALRNGTKYGIVSVEFYNGTNLLSTTQTVQRVQWGSLRDTWNPVSGIGTVPTGCNKVRVLVRCSDFANGDGRFFADDIYVRNVSRGAGAVYVDNLQENPGVVVKTHGTGKAAIFLYSVGDNSPDTGDDADYEPDVQPWKYRFDIMTAMIRNYFGVQPKISVTGTNAYLCLPEYRTTSNGQYLVHLKNYLYNTNAANGGAPLTFALSSSMLTGKTIRAFEQGKVIEENSDGVFNVTLDPDGQEVLYAYQSGTSGTNSTNFVCQISEAPSVVHPFGDKVYTIKVKYDCRSRTDLRVKAAFMENGNNGDTLTNEVYQILTNSVTGIGEQWFFMWIPDPNKNDPDYISTPDGGKYHFQAWLETPAAVKVAQAVPVPTILEWGIQVTNALSSTLAKGSNVAMNLEWEELYEALDWKNTPVARNESYPSRVAVYRSSKTEAQFPGHFTKVNAVCDWLQTLGYSNSNPQDILFDDVRVNGTFFDDFNDGNSTGWGRLAGCGNWTVSATPASGTSGTVGYWKCDEAAWSNGVRQVIDSSGRANHGTPVNGPRTTNDARRTRAGSFTATNYVVVTNTSYLQVNSNLTLSFWIKGKNIGSGRINPIDKSYGGEFCLTIETNRSLNFYQGSQRVSGKYTGWSALSANSVTNNSWMHIAITRDGKNRRLKSFVNGILMKTTTYANDTNTLPVKTTYPVQIGRGYTGYGLNGVMDEVKIYNTCLTDAQVLEDCRNSGSAYSLRANRIGNDDNIFAVSGRTFTNHSLSVNLRYAALGYYFSDAELMFRYVDRNNHCKVGVRNYYGAWRIKYTVKAGGTVRQQGWLYEFPKTNKPVANLWYNLKVEAYGSTNKVYFNDQLVGTFWATNFASGRVALSSRAEQLGIWEPQKGYYFIDDDENGMSGQPLNLDWGYMNQFYRTLILPSVYVMNDTEASNMVKWVRLGMNGILATDGSVAMRNESGAVDLGRVEDVFGVSAAVTAISNVTRVVIGTNDHYVTLDYAPNSSVTVSASGKPFTTLTRGTSLASVSNNGPLRLGLIATMITNNPGAPSKAFVFNFGADGSGLLTGNLKTLAKRAFEWLRNDAFKARIELKYVSPLNNPALDFVVYSTNVWVLSGTGTTNFTVRLPADGLMTGDNKFYWSLYTYAWDATNAWMAHNGFYSSGNDGSRISIAGKGLQVFGVTANAYAGRDWDMWVGYNTRSTTVSVAYGIKDKGATQYEDTFNDGNYTGWNVVASPRIAWSVSNNALQAKVTSVTTGGYGYIYWNGLAVTGKNITIEYSTTFTNNARDGGVIYRGRVLYVNPNLCGWADNTPNYFATNRPVPNKWQKVVVQIRDGSPYLMSDLFVDGKTVFLSEPIQVTSWTTNTVGFLSPYSNLNSVARWDNVRIADEQYSVTYTNVLGEKVPTNAAVPTFWPGIPDYDPQWWEHDGTTYGAGYEWYVYMHGEGLHGYADTKVYFAPRLRVELSTFPTNLSAATNVVVPIEWEKLPTNSAKLCVRLWDAYSGLIHVAKTSAISGVTGTTNVPVTVPTMPAGSNYVWTAFIFPNTATNPWVDRFGSDDTFRFDDKGIGVEPETMIRYTAPPATGGFYNVYSDGGIPVGASVFTWDSYRDWGVGSGPATFNGDYTGITPPEGTKCYLTATTNGTTYGGWGIFRAATDMRSYTNGYLKFWIRSGTPIKINLEGPQYTKGTVNVPSTTNTWQERSLPISSFSGIVLTNMYGLFEATVESTGAIFYIDNVRWSLTP